MDLGLGLEPEPGQQRSSEGGADFLRDAIEQAENAVSAYQHIHDAYKADVRMLAGDQWDEATRRDREDPEQPRLMLTFNQLPKYVRQVIGDARQNRLSIKVRPVEGDRGARVPNIAGNKDYSLAEVMEGLLRNIEYTSKAERAYDTALSHCVQGGIGWLRVIKRFSRPDGFEQELAIRAARDPLSVMLDPAAMFGDEPDMAGAEFGFVAQNLRLTSLEKRFGKDAVSVTSIPSSLTQAKFWGTEDTRSVLEFYRSDMVKQAYLLLSDGRVVPEPAKADIPQFIEWLQANQLQVARRRPGERRRVQWALLSCTDVLDGPYEWDGGHIPIIPVLGPELLVDDRVRYESLIRHSHDAQRNVNYWGTAAAERVALAPKAPWVVEARSIEGYEQDYKLALRKPVPYVRFKARDGVPPPKRDIPDAGGAAEISMAMQSNEHIKNTIGMYDASLGARSNETSGRAIVARQREADTGTFQWHDAIAKAVERVGVIVVDLVPAIYDTARAVRLRFPEDVEDVVAINQVIAGEDGKPVKVGDLGASKYDVTVAAGPSYATRRAEAAESMMGFVQAFPQSAPVVGDLVASSMDWPQSDAFAKRLKRLVPPNMLEPSEVAELQANQPPPDPQMEAQAQAQAQIMQAETQANVTNAEANRVKADAALAEAQALAPERVKELVAEALAEVLPALLGGGQANPS